MNKKADELHDELIRQAVETPDAPLDQRLLARLINALQDERDRLIELEQTWKYPVFPKPKPPC